MSWWSGDVLIPGHRRMQFVLLEKRRSCRWMLSKTGSLIANSFRYFPLLSLIRFTLLSPLPSNCPRSLHLPLVSALFVPPLSVCRLIWHLSERSLLMCIQKKRGSLWPKLKLISLHTEFAKGNTHNMEISLVEQFLLNVFKRNVTVSKPTKLNDSILLFSAYPQPSSDPLYLNGYLGAYDHLCTACRGGKQHLHAAFLCVLFHWFKTLFIINNQ